MTKVLHVIARQEGIAPKGVSPTGNENEYVSKCWVKLGNNPKQLIGGCIYLHESSTVPSKMGGIVVDVVPCKRETKQFAILDGTAFVFVASAEAKGIDWRGKGSVRHGHGGIMEADASNEVEGNG